MARESSGLEKPLACVRMSGLSSSHSVSARLMAELRRVMGRRRSPRRVMPLRPLGVGAPQLPGIPTLDRVCV